MQCPRIFHSLCSSRREGVLPKCRSATGPRSQRPERGPTCGNLANFHTRTRCERGPFALRLRFSHLGNTPLPRLLQGGKRFKWSLVTSAATRVVQKSCRQAALPRCSLCSAAFMEVPDSFYELVENVCRDLYIQSLKEIPPDVVEAIRRAAATETKEVAKRIFSHYLKSIELGQTENMIVCQDTGIPIYWVDIGGNLRLDGARLNTAIVRGTERATREHPLRSSIVSPLQRENRQTSTGERIPIIHYGFVPDSDVLDILFMPKGSGSENMSSMKMLVPAEGVNGIKRFVLEQVVGAGAKPCQPTIVGVGIGGSSDLCMTLAKRATTRPLGTPNPDAQLAALEAELFEAINQTGIGPQGLGGDTTALGVHIESAWTHITCNPVAVNIQCWRAERRRARISPDGNVEIGF